jgi:hypothetical protein
MAKPRSNSQKLLLIVIPFIIVPVLAFCFLPFKFTPPAPGTPEAIVPSIPAREQIVPVQQTPPELQVSESSPVQHDAGIPADLIVQDFYKRHTALPVSPNERMYEGRRKDFFKIATEVLGERESPNTLLALLNHPDKNVRIAAVRALDDAQAAGLMQGQGGIPALLKLWDKMDSEQCDIAVVAAVETLVEETNGGLQGSAAASVLWTIGDAALPAVPHLIWASDNSPSATMRMGHMNNALMLDPGSNAVADLIDRRRGDANGWVRLEAVQVTLQRIASGFVGEDPIPSLRPEPEEKRAQTAFIAAARRN